MKLQEVLTPSFKALREQLGTKKEQKPLIQVSADSDFCRDVVAHGCLTEEQMAHAAERYRLGKSKSGRCIFWMIDESGSIRDGHIGDSWASVMLKAREPRLLCDYYPIHCFFGQHLLDSPLYPVCIIEKESSAVILSEVFTDCIWLATVYPTNFNVFSFECLQGYDVTLFPPTDETMTTYTAWCELAEQARQMYQRIGSIEVKDVLELNATPEQKAARIDLLDFIF